MKDTDKDIAATGAPAFADFRAVCRRYYYLTKPGIIRGNLFTAVAGFLLAAQGTILPGTLAAMIAGLALVIASGCVVNNYIDRHIDIKMARTARRALVTGAIGTPQAIGFAAILGAAGTLTLVLGTNLLTAGLAVFGWLAYVVLYGIGKRKTIHGTLIGSISGAIPPVVGYTAASGRVDMAAVILFLILVAWQMPHFYAIGIFRHHDYRAAGLPILPVKSGFTKTKAHMILFGALFIFAAASLSITGLASEWYGIAMTVIGTAWLLQLIQGLRLQAEDLTIHWAKKVFGSSILVLTLFSIALGIDSFLG